MDETNHEDRAFMSGCCLGDENVPANRWEAPPGSIVLYRDAREAAVPVRHGCQGIEPSVGRRKISPHTRVLWTTSLAQQT